MFHKKLRACEIAWISKYTYISDDTVKTIPDEIIDSPGGNGELG